MRINQVVIEVRRRGGICRVSSVLDRGFSRRDVDGAVSAGLLSRPIRGWLAVPGADADLLRAARAGVVLSCLTQAQRLGLWVHDRRTGIHAAATPGSSGQKPKDMTVHWFTPLIPRHPEALVDPIENVLAAVAACEPFEQALATWDSALNKNLVTLEALRRFSWKPAARRILEQATPFADAGLETYLRPRLRWLRLPLRIQTWIHGHRVDVLIGARLIIQIDGGTHVGAQRLEDNRHDAELRLMGYHVIRVGYQQVINEWEVVQNVIMRAVAQGLHLAA
ncbi:endonuclease domain-containing protein [Microbacterium murale]|uniref:Very-short-patch-repair endonuclease n=1 Tax=Microbacterium murale TaxID=1081040 RepID=A0ABU0P3F2_9MICO|nr:DUF559 domain-containing protein [Microbacterium murale]MDQ0641865.1 very-short-patch-repair endonuclease [Microbacterium murale]